MQRKKEKRGIIMILLLSSLSASSASSASLRFNDLVTATMMIAWRNIRSVERMGGTND